MNLPELSVKRPVFIASLMFVLILSGLFSLMKLGVDLFPDVNFPMVIVQSVYPGASPNDVETQVSKVLEEELAGLPNMKRISSTSSDSVSFVMMEFRMDADIKDSEQQVRNRINNVRRKLPADLEEPIIGRVDPTELPVMRLAIKSDLPMTRLYDIIKDEVNPVLERVNGVGRVDIIGARKREIKVLVNRDKLQERNLSLLQVSNSLTSSSVNVPVGKVEDGSTETVLRTIGEFDTLPSINSVVLSLIDHPVKLGTIARVFDGEEEENTRSALNGSPAVFVDVFKQSGTNTVEVADGVKVALEKANKTLDAKQLAVDVSVLRDGAAPIKANVFDVYETILIGIILCVIVVFFFLGSGRSTIITGLALPNSLLGAFILMYVMGFTINMMTLLALSLTVGLLVDDAIVVRENIFRHMEMGKSAYRAALDGTKEVMLAVIATSSVVIAVFGPIAFLEGIIGQFFKQFGLTIVFAMLISMIDAFTVAPMLSAHWAKLKHRSANPGPVQRLLDSFDRFQTWLETIYVASVRWTLNHRKKVIGAGTAIFVGSLALIPLIPSTFLPAEDIGEFTVRLETPIGTNLDTAAKIAAKIDEQVRKNPNVAVTAAVTGTTDGQSNVANIYVRLVSPKERKVTTTEMKDILRKDLAVFSDKAVIRVQDYNEFGGDDRPFMMFIEGQNLDDVNAYAAKVIERIQKIPGLVEVDTNYRSGKPEFQVVFDRDRAGERGVSVSQAGMELRARVEGMTPAVFRENGREYDIRVQLEDQWRDLKQTFSSNMVPNINGRLVSLNQVASGKDVSGFSKITRQNRARYIMIGGDIGTGGALGDIVKEVEKIMKEELPPPAGISWSFQGMAEDFQSLLVNMGLAILAAIILIYLVLASLYDSFITPFTILLALPMAVCGTLVALFLFNKSIDIFSLIGIIMLLGVVAKNSILLVDYTLKLNTEKGLDRTEALLTACKTRLRPILMTSIALIAGMVPVAIGLNEVSSQRTSMGVAIIGGLFSSTLLTLIIVPAAYGYIDDLRRWLSKGKKAEVAVTSSKSDALTISH